MSRAGPPRVERVVVTGGAGFLGSHLCERLVGQGCEVVALDSLLTGRPDNLDGVLGHERFRLVKCDITDYVHVPGPVDAVLHLACPASPADHLRFPVETLTAGSTGTLHALGLAKEKGARLLLASSGEVYGDPQVQPQPETYWGHVDPVAPRGVHDEAKRFAEALTTAYRTHHGVDTTIARIFSTFGPRMRGDDGRAVPTFLRQALAGEPLTVAGDGSQTRSFCYVDDLVDGLLRLVRSRHPGPVNLGHPQAVPVLALARTVLDVTGSASPIEFVPRPPGDPGARRPDTALARTVLGWEPRVSLGDGLTETVRWLRRPAEVPGALATRQSRCTP
ncbi:NAD-dependent epimerase/dehydratase family protein [Geodermatophilus sp. SYSU D00758]